MSFKPIPLDLIGVTSDYIGSSGPTIPPVDIAGVKYAWTVQLYGVAGFSRQFIVYRSFDGGLQWFPWGWPHGPNLTGGGAVVFFQAAVNGSKLTVCVGTPQPGSLTCHFLDFTFSSGTYGTAYGATGAPTDGSGLAVTDFSILSTGVYFVVYTKFSTTSTYWATFDPNLNSWTSIDNLITSAGAFPASFCFADSSDRIHIVTGDRTPGFNYYRWVAGTLSGAIPFPSGANGVQHIGNMIEFGGNLMVATDKYIPPGSTPVGAVYTGSPIGSFSSLTEALIPGSGQNPTVDLRIFDNNGTAETYFPSTDVDDPHGNFAAISKSVFSGGVWGAAIQIWGDFLSPAGSDPYITWNKNPPQDSVTVQLNSVTAAGILIGLLVNSENVQTLGQQNQLHFLWPVPAAAATINLAFGGSGIGA